MSRSRPPTRVRALFSPPPPPRPMRIRVVPVCEVGRYRYIPFTRSRNNTRYIPHVGTGKRITRGRGPKELWSSRVRTHADALGANLATFARTRTYPSQWHSTAACMRVYVRCVLR